jgi:D-hexose-6-phosphate mutarotase
MLELIHISGTKATINPEGAFVESWKAADGTDLLFARRNMASGKNRGGIPVCAPIFGPGESVGLNQHGFARNVKWKNAHQNESQVKLSLDNPLSQVEDLPPVYAGLSMELTIEIKENGLSETLLLKNIGIEPCLVNPAFHPYYPVDSSESAENVSVIIDGQTYNFTSDELAATRKIDSISSSAQFITSRGSWTVTGEGLPLFAIWSESPADFICVEPTESGYLSDNPASKLMPSETKTVCMTIQYLP